MSCKHLARLSVLLAVFMALLLPTADAGKGGGSTPLVLDLYDKVVDEQDTQTFYTAQGLTGDFCSTSELPFTQNSAFKGDHAVAWSSGWCVRGVRQLVVIRDRPFD